ncbi:MAG TPA: oxidoreductase [Dehalococcoidia bacterium]|nr:oxidoreductase [Dehalococcoidia bacterium]
MPQTYRALVVDKQDGVFSVGVRELPFDQLPAGDVTIRVAYSTVNYKDGLACTADGRIIRGYPMVPGVDLAGTVTDSMNGRFKAGDEVVVTGFDQGVSHPGGFAEYARVPAGWVVKLPAGLSLREAMALGTAGFTAGLSVQRLEENGLRPGNGPVLVTGATGGVGSTAVSMLAGRGYEVAASTGKSSEHGFLRGLGAGEILTREEVSAQSNRPLEKERWAAGVDPVGGDTLAYLVRTTKYGGSVASSGLTGGTALSTTVFPFILRGVSLLGIESVMCPMAVREPLWQRLAGDLKPKGLSDSIAHEITLEQVPEVVPVILRGGVTGRAVVRIGA